MELAELHAGGGAPRKKGETLSVRGVLRCVSPLLLLGSDPVAFAELFQPLVLTEESAASVYLPEEEEHALGASATIFSMGPMAHELAAALGGLRDRPVRLGGLKPALLSRGTPNERWVLRATSRDEDPKKRGFRVEVEALDVSRLARIPDLRDALAEVDRRLSRTAGGRPPGRASRAVDLVTPVPSRGSVFRPEAADNQTLDDIYAGGGAAPRPAASSPAGPSAPAEKASADPSARARPLPGASFAADGTPCATASRGEALAERLRRFTVSYSGVVTAANPECRVWELDGSVRVYGQHFPLAPAEQALRPGQAVRLEHVHPMYLFGELQGFALCLRSAIRAASRKRPRQESAAAAAAARQVGCGCGPADLRRCRRVCARLGASHALWLHAAADALRRAWRPGPLCPPPATPSPFRCAQALDAILNGVASPRDRDACREFTAHDEGAAGGCQVLTAGAFAPEAAPQVLSLDSILDAPAHSPPPGAVAALLLRARRGATASDLILERRGGATAAFPVQWDGAVWRLLPNPEDFLRAASWAPAAAPSDPIALVLRADAVLPVAGVLAFAAAGVVAPSANPTPAPAPPPPPSGAVGVRAALASAGGGRRLDAVVGVVGDAALQRKRRVAIKVCDWGTPHRITAYCDASLFTGALAGDWPPALRTGAQVALRGFALKPSRKGRSLYLEGGRGCAVELLGFAGVGMGMGMGMGVGGAEVGTPPRPQPPAGSHDVPERAYWAMPERALCELLRRDRVGARDLCRTRLSLASVSFAKLLQPPAPGPPRWEVKVIMEDGTARAAVHADGDAALALLTALPQATDRGCSAGMDAAPPPGAAARRVLARRAEAALARAGGGAAQYLGQRRKRGGAAGEAAECLLEELCVAATAAQGQQFHVVGAAMAAERAATMLPVVTITVANMPLRTSTLPFFSMRADAVFPVSSARDVAYGLLRRIRGRPGFGE